MNPNKEIPDMLRSLINEYRDNCTSHMDEDLLVMKFTKKIDRYFNRLNCEHDYSKTKFTTFLKCFKCGHVTKDGEI